MLNGATLENRKSHLAIKLWKNYFGEQSIHLTDYVITIQYNLHARTQDHKYINSHE